MDEKQAGQILDELRRLEERPVFTGSSKRTTAVFRAVRDHKELKKSELTVVLRSMGQDCAIFLYPSSIRKVLKYNASKLWDILATFCEGYSRAVDDQQREANGAEVIKAEVFAEALVSRYWEMIRHR